MGQAAATKPVSAWSSRRVLQVGQDLVCDEPMDQFIAKHADKLEGTLSCFDRVLFRGYLPLFSGAAMAAFLDSRGIRRPELKRFLLRQAYLLKDHARRMARRGNRPFQYFGERVRKEELARQIVSNRGSSACSRRSSRVGPTRYAGAKPRTFNRRGASVCSCTTTSWIASSA